MDGPLKNGDAIDSAIEKAEIDTLVAQARLAKGGIIRLFVPADFGPDEFESAVGLLMQLRVKADTLREQRKHEASGLVLPDRPKLVIP